MSGSTLCPGYFIILDCVGQYNHFIGGENTLEGGVCPNCEKPFLQYLTLDTSDPRLNLKTLPVRQLRLLYCTRCAIQTSLVPFCYQFVDSNAIRLVEYRASPAKDWPYEREWREDGFGDTFEYRPIALKPIPPRLQELYDRQNDRHIETTLEEWTEMKRLGNSYAAYAEFGKVASASPPNLIGGRPLFNQRIDIPCCSVCRMQGADREMSCLASLFNSELDGFKIAFSGFQIVFFMCQSCGAIHGDQIV